MSPETVRPRLSGIQYQKASVRLFLQLSVVLLAFPGDEEPQDWIC